MRYRNTSLHFIAQIIEEDLGRRPDLELRFRFPPEPNGHLHLGHSKALSHNFELARKYNGSCHLRFDDTDPIKESEEYVRSILEDVAWLGYSVEHVAYASDYFEKLYKYAKELIKMGKAYVDSHSSEVFAAKYKGTSREAGKESPFRGRSVSENLQLFEEMQAGKHTPGSLTLRAKIDMLSPNMHMRDPVMYRIKAGGHFRTQDRWKVYPMYDFAHCVCDAIEGITHSLCSLEFEVHRPLYEWFLETLGLSGPRQIEFARLSLSHTVLSKRKILALIERNLISGWDDPQILTLSGLRRRGYTPSSLLCFIERIGLSKRRSLTDMALLQWSLREELNTTAERRMAILRPLRVRIENYPEKKVEWLSAQNNPEDPSVGSRKLPFGREIYIEETDFCEQPPPEFYRLAPGQEVRLKYAYIIRCEEAVRSSSGELLYLRCSYGPNTRSGTEGAKRKTKATLSWLSVEQSITAEVRQYGQLFSEEDPESDDNYLQDIRSTAVEHVSGVRLESSLAVARAGERYQFERQGYYCRDETRADLFHQSVPLRDSYKKGKR